MPRFYFEVQTSSGVERDMTGVDVADPVTALYECLEVVDHAITATDFNDLMAVTIKDADETVVASINVGRSGERLGWPAMAKAPRTTTRTNKKAIVTAHQSAGSRG